MRIGPRHIGALIVLAATAAVAATATAATSAAPCKVVYRDVFKLWSVDPEGGAPIELSSYPIRPGMHAWISWSDDGRLAAMAQDDTLQVLDSRGGVVRSVVLDTVPSIL